MSSICNRPLSPAQIVIRTFRSTTGSGGSFTSRFQRSSSNQPTVDYLSGRAEWLGRFAVSNHSERSAMSIEGVVEKAGMVGRKSVVNYCVRVEFGARFSYENKNHVPTP